MSSANLEMLQAVALGLGHLKDIMVFVGGSVAELYATYPELSDIRPTLDVDCVIELRSKTMHAQLEDNLRAQGFANDTSKGAPICRWIYKNVLVDVMPSDSNILGFSNTWYAEGVVNKIVKTLPDGTDIFVFTPEYYLATKLEAHKGRGGDDLRQSHDFEDIIYILDNCAELYDCISRANKTVKLYLKAECTHLLQNVGLTEGIESALPYGFDDETTDIIFEKIKHIADIG